MSYYVKFTKTAIISIISLLLYQFFFYNYYFNNIDYNTIMTLVFNQMYHVTYFFLHKLYQLFFSGCIMSIIAIKTYYDTIKTLIFIQLYYMHYVFWFI